MLLHIFFYWREFWVKYLTSCLVNIKTVFFWVYPHLFWHFRTWDPVGMVLCGPSKSRGTIRGCPFPVTSHRPPLTVSYPHCLTPDPPTQGTQDLSPSDSPPSSSRPFGHVPTLLPPTHGTRDPPWEDFTSVELDATPPFSIYLLTLYLNHGCRFPFRNYMYN